MMSKVQHMSTLQGYGPWKGDLDCTDLVLVFLLLALAWGFSASAPLTVVLSDSLLWTLSCVL